MRFSTIVHNTGVRKFATYRVVTLIVLLSIHAVTTVYSADLPFHKGVNLTNWFQAAQARQIHFTTYTKQDFINIKRLGCDVIRVPINMHSMTSGEPDHIIDPLLYYFLDQVVEWAEELEINLILDNHSFDSAVNTDPHIDSILIPVWLQLAEHYNDCSTYLYYEVLNEPHGIPDSSWNSIQQAVVDAIRSVDQTHTIIIGSANGNSYYNLGNMPLYDDQNLIYTFHFYDPFIFTHQGADWTNPSLEPLAGVPFPHESSRMPACPPELAGTWIETEMNDYESDGTVARVQQLIDIAHAFKTERNIQLFCGEFGVFMPNSNTTDRIYWYQTVRDYLEAKEIPWAMWDYKGNFGLFEAGSNELFDHDLNIPLVEALGLYAPPQSPFILAPDETGFDIYLDFIAQNILESSWTDQPGILDFYSDHEPLDGAYCIYWTDVTQYNRIGFDFKPIKDLSVLLDNGYMIDFWIKGDTPGATFDIRFVDTKTDAPDDHPWRMRMTIDETIAKWDGKWHHATISLSDFTEQGSWDNNEWFTPRGDFDWHAVEHFQIVAEHHSLQGIRFWFDNVRIVTTDDIIKTGDINNDGIIDMTDAILAVKVLASHRQPGAVYKFADVNGGGKIGIEEVIFIIQHVAQLR